MHLLELNLVVDAKTHYWTGLKGGRVSINSSEVAAVFETEDGTNILLKTPLTSGLGDELRRIVVKETYEQVITALQSAQS